MKFSRAGKIYEEEMDGGLAFIVRCLLSTVIVSASVAFVIYAVVSGERTLGLPPALHVILLISALSFLAYFESGQVAIVNLSSIDEKQSTKIQETHPRAFDVYRTIAKPGMVERYLMGRQLCVIGLVFFISQLTTFPSLKPILPPLLEKVLIRSGLPGNNELLDICFVSKTIFIIACC